MAWLREFAPVDLGAEELAELLTARGVEVEGIERPWEGLAGVTVARVGDVRDHPGADRLVLATVEDGSGARDVVVGVRNMRPGDLVPYAPPGASLPALDRPLERREIRGVPSEGMLCSPWELGIAPDHDRILVLDQGEPGESVAALLGIDEPVLDIEVFPNRPDLLSVVGVAREVAAATDGELRSVDISVDESQEAAADAAWVEVEDREGCPRYVARVIRGVRPGAAPPVVQARLTACGMRPLGAAVDASNYVLLELGHPTHPFDLAALEGGGVVVRRAQPGERMTTLDDVERTFGEEDLLIADRKRAVGIAGILGSASAEVSEATSDVLLESAWFEPRGILRTASRLGIRTEASVRFERTADPEAPGPAAARVARLTAAWTGGTVLRGAVDVGRPPPRRSVSVRPARAASLLGVSVTPDDVASSMRRLRLASRPAGDRIEVEVPGFRADLDREVDLIEEVARDGGYTRIGSTLPGVKMAGGLTAEQRATRRLRDLLAAAGLYEVRSTSFVPPSDLELFADDRRRGVRVANPISVEDAYLRSSLLGGLLRAGRTNAARRRSGIRLYEVGTVFTDGSPPLEEERVAVLVTGLQEEEWPGERREQDALDAKGILEHLLERMSMEWTVGPPGGGPLHPGRSASVLVAGEPIGEVGEIRPAVARAFDLPSRVGWFEVLTAPLLATAGSVTSYVELSRFPPVHRDLAFAVARDVPAGAVRDALVDAGGDLVDRVALFDVFEGHPLPEDTKNLAFRVDFRAPDRTLTDEEVEERVRAVVDRLAREFGARLRTGGREQG